MEQEILAEWNPWWAGLQASTLVERELLSEVTRWIGRKEIVGILGVRRGGKSSLFRLVINELQKTHSAKNILFIKGDDDRVSKKDLISDAISTYREMMNPQGKIFVFIDEVQEIDGWDATLKRMYDLDSNAKFFISGSNFSVHKEMLSYKLAGRVAYFDLYPFSFSEYLKLHLKIDFQNKAALLSKKHEISHLLLKYLEFGGFPEVTLETDEKRKIQLLQYYYDTIVYRDIIKRRGIRSPEKMERVINYFLQNISNLSNFTKISKLAMLSTDTVVEYSKYLQEAFLIFNVPMFSYSVKQQEINPKKTYCIDTGMRNVKGFRFSKDYGRLIENLVFIELKRRNSANPLAEIYYFSSKEGEVDFVLKQGLEVRALIQVCWDFKDEEVRIREIKGLKSAMSDLKVKEGLLITKEQLSGKIPEMEDKHIKFLPLWKWLLEEGGSN
ncbi:ATP-binding protein [Candidatus Micrarchaeota archaeon]|nr:ATP-binding protein [Candidatus Micrarchaeota archaeon]